MLQHPLRTNPLESRGQCHGHATSGAQILDLLLGEGLDAALLQAGVRCMCACAMSLSMTGLVVPMMRMVVVALRRLPEGWDGE